MEQLCLGAVKPVHQSPGIAPQGLSEPALINTPFSIHRATRRRPQFLPATALTFLCFQLTFAQTSTGPVRLYPVDDSAREPGFHSYVLKLQAAFDKRDEAAILRGWNIDPAGL